MKLITIKQFAQELQISKRTAYQMARSQAFIKNGISHDISCGKPPNNSKRKRIRRNRQWRIVIERYYDALDKGLLNELLRVV